MPPRPQRTCSRRAVLAGSLGALAAGGERWARADSPEVAHLTFFGQSFFLLETTSGTRIAMDPFGPGTGQEPPAPLRVDAVTISHEHPDHNHLGVFSNKPRVLRGLTPDRKGWIKVDERIKDVSVRSVGVYHDDALGAERGLDTIFVFDVAGVRIAHLGDLGHRLTDGQLSAIGQIDVVLIPVGGGATVDAQEAARVVDQLRPRLLVVPMHHRGEAGGAKTAGKPAAKEAPADAPKDATKDAQRDLASVDEFVRGRPHVRREPGSRVAITTIKRRPWAETVVLTPAPP